MGEHKFKQFGDVNRLRQHFSVEAENFDWLIILQNLCVALQHPLNRSTSRHVTASFTRQLGNSLVDRGVLAEPDLYLLWKKAGITELCDVDRDETPTCPMCTQPLIQVPDGEATTVNA